MLYFQPYQGRFMLGSVWDDAGNISGEQSEGHSRLIPGEEISHRTAGNVVLGLSLEGLQGTAELSPWEGETGVLEICWTSPGKTSAQGQSMRLLGGGWSSSLESESWSGWWGQSCPRPIHELRRHKSRDPGMESHPAPAGARSTRCVARMGPVPRSRCPRSIRAG